MKLSIVYSTISTSSLVLNMIQAKLEEYMLEEFVELRNGS